MRNGTIAALLMVIVLVSAGAGYIAVRAIQQTSNQAPNCLLAPKGSTLYIKTTLDDGITPVTRVIIDATPVETCNGVGTTIAIIYRPAVNDSGVATLDASGSTYFSVTVYDGSHSHLFSVYTEHAEQGTHNATCASIELPSGSLSVSTC